MNSKELIDLEDKYGAHNYHPLDVILAKGEGIWLYDLDGNKYLDFLSAYSSVNQGHCHPRLVKTLTEQAKKLTITSRAFRNNQLGALCKELCEFTGMEKMLPMNSGAEAVETAIKVARKWGYKTKGVKQYKAEIIVCADNFHGRTSILVRSHRALRLYLTEIPGRFRMPSIKIQLHFWPSPSRRKPVFSFPLPAI